MNRKQFLGQLGLLSAGSFLFSHSSLASMKNKRILVVSGWQDVNIGDITHTPGLLHILETYLPSVQVTLWKRSNGEDVKTMLNQNFPNVKIIYGGVDEQLNVNNPEITEAFKNHDFMLHGSGPSIVGQQNLEAWIKATGKPFGIFGTTIQDINPKLKALLQKASFIYTRETASIKVLNDNGISGSHIGFAPDATFYIDLENKQKADAFLKSAGLTPGKFICAVPRLRYTPYHKFKQTGWSQQRINLVETTNEKFKEQDHAKLREAIVTWVRQTKNKVLVCPEMTYEVDIMDELLINPLPDDVKPYVVKRGYWLPDEAASVYEQAFSVLSFECHSPIIAAAKKSLFLYLRQPEDTIKGQMYYDLDFNDWVFEIEQTTGKQISDRLMSTWNNQAGAKKALAQSMAKVDKLYKAATTLVAASI